MLPSLLLNNFKKPQNGNLRTNNTLIYQLLALRALEC